MAELPSPATTADEVRRITESVLARPEFAGAQPSWWDRLWTAIVDVIRDVVAAISAGDRGSVIGTVALVAVAVVAAVLVVRFTRSVRPDPSAGVAVEGNVGRSARDWRLEAEDHEAAGRWRDAVRCRYREVLAELVAAGLVDEIPGRTSGEYLRAVAAEVPGAHEALADITRRFEAAWYGHVPTTADDVAAVASGADATLRAAGVRRRFGVPA